MVNRDNETVKFEATTEAKLDRVFSDISRIANCLEETNRKLRDIESWHWRIMGGVAVVSAAVSLIMVALFH